MAPLIGALLAIAWPRRSHAIGLASSAVLAAGSAGLLTTVWRSGELRIGLGGWPAPLGIELRADGLAAAMIALSVLVGGVLGASARAYFRDDRLRIFWPLWLFLQVALAALFLSGDVFNLYVTLELMSLSAVGLVALSRDRPAVAAAFRYLIVSLVGSLAYLFGVALLYGELGRLDLAMLAEGLEHSPSAALAAALMTAGLALKGALFPLHFWLPPAHASAPAPVSAALSALVVKGTAYILLRLWVEVFPASAWIAALDLLALLGGGALIWGGVQALRAERLKLVVAYSTVAQLGYFGLALPLAALDGMGGTGWQAMVLFFLAHGLAKAGLFAAAGAVLRQEGHDQVGRLSEAAVRLPAAFLAMGLAAVSLIGLPPSGGFAAKWLMLAAAVEHARWGTIAALAAGTLLSGAYLFRVLQPAFVPATAPSDASIDPGARSLATGGLLLAIGAAGMGLFVDPTLRLLARVSVVSGGFTP
jgi:formate hydrogenlyase subunit 3/multisubunit Na+/H+ antiporter MnhD subunit